ncbi:hypothetical protein CcI156_05675 [Frankia sp. CcI156]|nr:MULTISPECIES: hypothetical protein [Frankia]OHV48560.1 hypothetical protein CgIS1_06020 [Frankia sp. CgIS1]ONH28202.1 hypothetical protein CcI156_05675 [Frankia sp. CcI156]TFE33735.1 hypothetical protein E0F15_04710 [Frankia sp. B2]
MSSRDVTAPSVTTPPVTTPPVSADPFGRENHRSFWAQLDGPVHYVDLGGATRRPAAAVRARSRRLPPPLARLRPTAHPGLPVPRLAAAVLAYRRGRYTPHQLVDENLRRLCADPGRVPPAAIAAMVRAQSERGGIPGADQAYVGAARSVVWSLVRPASLAHMVRTVRQPTLLVHGSADRLIPVGVARHVAAERPDWRVEILDRFGHMPMLEAKAHRRAGAGLAGPGGGARPAAAVAAD